MRVPVQAFSADFELQGNAQAGSLVLSTALGSTLASLRWDSVAATLQTTGEPQEFDSLASLVRQVTGTDLPVASLFSWLRGQSSDAQPWEADLSQLNQGRLTARRVSTFEPAELKLILDR